MAEEGPFDSERQLHEAIAAHPEVLPAEDLHLGPLVAIASELDFGAGPMDLLAVEERGRLVVVEFKRGSENPDVRRVVAQVLDYGSMLWRIPYETLEDRARSSKPGFAGTLADHVQDSLHQLGRDFDADVFSRGVRRCLDAGDFIFIYVGRDLDERTRRIMTYLSEGPHMTFFAVEVERFRAGTDESFVLVPRTAFIPSWVTSPPVDLDGAANLASASPGLQELTRRMDALARDLDLRVDHRRTGTVYLPKVLENVPSATSGVGVYATGRGLEINLSVFEPLDKKSVAERLQGHLHSIFPERKIGLWPAISPDVAIERWSQLLHRVIRPYFEERSANAGNEPSVL